MQGEMDVYYYKATFPEPFLKSLISNLIVNDKINSDYNDHDSNT